MENNIELFDGYIDETLSPEEKRAFEQRLKEDKEFAREFRIYLFVLDGIYKEAEQENLDFGIAMKRIGKEDLKRILQRGKKKRFSFRNLLWAGSVAAMFIIGIFTVFTVRKAGMNRVDDLIVAYNDLPALNRGGESIDEPILYCDASDKEISDAYISHLEKAYREVPADEVQDGEEAGMRLAMAYLKKHDRKKAKALLEELCERYSDDPMFVGQCRRILNQLK
ncbi:MAG: hypothetical protein K2M53_01500 [Muribaculaceae bacterium]|nr:hypothetical protein [Muribaculaceae bacterium]